MSTIRQLVNAALTAVFPNAWAVELPPEPMLPALVFDIESRPEDGWCMGGGYVEHDVHLVVVAHTMEELDVLLPQHAGDSPAIVPPAIQVADWYQYYFAGNSLRAALEAMPAYQYEEACGDADYEPDPNLYARYLTVRLRTPLY